MERIIKDVRDTYCMNHINLKQIGLTEGEIKVYDALLSVGECSKAKLAKESEVSPSKIYDVCNRLARKGLISIVKKHGVLHFKAANPERLYDFLNIKEQELKKEKSVIDSLLPSLLQKYSEFKEDTDVEVFYGWQGMVTCYDDIINTCRKGDTNYIFGASMGKDFKRADQFFNQYMKKANKKGFSIRIIFNENVRGHQERTNFYHNKPHDARFMLQDTFLEINTYKDTVLLVMLFKKPIVIRVRGKEAADSFRKFFATMWTQAKK